MILGSRSDFGLLARDRVGGLAALESEHDGSPGLANGAKVRACSRKVSLRDALTVLYLAMIERNAILLKYASYRGVSRFAQTPDGQRRKRTMIPIRGRDAVRSTLLVG
jgi:hypothetical protein